MTCSAKLARTSEWTGEFRDTATSGLNMYKREIDNALEQVTNNVLEQVTELGDLAKCSDRVIEQILNDGSEQVPAMTCSAFSSVNSSYICLVQKKTCYAIARRCKETCGCIVIQFEKVWFEIEDTQLVIKIY